MHHLHHFESRRAFNHCPMSRYDLYRSRSLSAPYSFINMCKSCATRRSRRSAKLIWAVSCVGVDGARAEVVVGGAVGRAETNDA